MNYLVFAREYKNIFPDASPDDVKQAYEVSQRNDNLGKFASKYLANTNMTFTQLCSICC